MWQYIRFDKIPSRHRLGVLLTLYSNTLFKSSSTFPSVDTNEPLGAVFNS